MEQSTTQETASCAFKNFPAFHGTQRFITAFTRTLHLTLSWAKTIQPIQPIWSDQINLIITNHLCLDLPSGLFPLGFRTNNIYAFLPHSCYMTYPSHPRGLHHSDYTWRTLQVMKLLVMQFSPPSHPHHPVFEHLQSKTKFHTHTKPWAKLQYSIFWFLCFLTVNKKTVAFGLNGTKHYQNLISSWIKFWFVIVIFRWPVCYFTSQFSPAFWCWDSNIYFSFLNVISKPPY
jgi:hypothetical protein